MTMDIVESVDVTEEGCWSWLGRVGRDGYGRQGRSSLAHRFVYEQIIGPIPEGMTLDHLCRNRRCVNPDHLEPVTVAENIKRGVPYWDRPRPDRCPQGHEYTDHNTYVDKHGRWSCVECRRKHSRAWKERQRG